jgi:hypothetical protein
MKTLTQERMERQQAYDDREAAALDDVQMREY